MIWKDIKKEKPIATESGCWDGLRTERILVCTTGGIYHIARMYEGILDGSKFCDFYTEMDYELPNVAFWTEIDAPF